MKEREVCSELKIRHFVITEATPHSNLSEKEIIKHLQKQGYKVYKDYSFYFRERVWDDIKKEYYYPNTSRLQKKTLLKVCPKFPESIYKLFNKHANGEPDVLLEKDGVWRFVEIKTSTDSVRYNQLIFLEELAKLWDTSVQFYTNLSGIPEANPKKLSDHHYRISMPGDEFMFQNEVIQLVEKQKKFKFKPFWIVVEAFLKAPRKVFNSASYRLIISEKSGLPLDKVNWFVKNNCPAIAKKEADKLYEENIITKDNINWFPKYEELIEIGYGRGEISKHINN